MNRQLFREALRDQKGGVLVVMAFSFAMLIGAAALAVDMSYAYVTETRLQVAADSAAMAAASQLPDEGTAVATALDYVEKNMAAAQHGTVLDSNDVQTGNWNSDTRVFTAAGTPLNAVQIVTRRSEDNGNPLGLFFGRILGMGETNVSSVAIARKGGDPICVLALEPTGNSAMALDSNSGVNLVNCAVHVNSTGSSALQTNSNATVSAASICVGGGYGGSTSSFDPEPTIDCDPIQDPLADLVPPAITGCDHTNFAEDNYTEPMHPGIYCGGLELNSDSNTTFNAGVYVIKGGNFYLDSNTVVSGTGVVFYLTEGAHIEFNSNTSVDFTAPSTGPYAGVLFYQDPNEGGIHVLDSNTIAQLQGVIYLPNGDLHSDSNANLAGSSTCTLLVARRFDFNSNALLGLTFDPATCNIPTPSELLGTASALVD